MITVGVPKEIKNREYRVGIVPSAVKELCRHGHTVIVQKGAGLGVGISDEDYTLAGAQIAQDAEQVYSKADMIMKVKEPLPEEYKLLKEGQVLYAFLHLAADKDLAKVLLDKRIVSVAFETIQNNANTDSSSGRSSLPVLTPMSIVAGNLATQIGAGYLQKDRGGKGVLLGGVPGVNPGHVVILGGGVVGTQAAKIAVGLGAKVTILDINLQRLQQLSEMFANTVTTIFSNAQEIENALKTADLLIGAVLVTGAKAPTLVTRNMLSEMKNGGVVVDVAVDQGGSIETSHPTSHENPTYVEQGVIHYAVPNMPALVPYTSTYALANVTTRYALEIADLGWKKAAQSDPGLYMGINTHEGKVTYKQVADALDLPYKRLEI